MGNVAVSVVPVCFCQLIYAFPPSLANASADDGAAAALRVQLSATGAGRLRDAEHACLRVPTESAGDDASAVPGPATSRSAIRPVDLAAAGWLATAIERTDAVEQWPDGREPFGERLPPGPDGAQHANATADANASAAAASAANASAANAAAGSSALLGYANANAAYARAVPGNPVSAAVPSILPAGPGDHHAKRYAASEQHAAGRRANIHWRNARSGAGVPRLSPEPPTTDGGCSHCD